MRASRILPAAVLAVAGALLVPSLASAALNADSVTIGSTPAHVRVVVHFSGGPPLTGLERQTDAIDPQPLDGRAVVRINATGITTGAAQVSGSGVTVKVGQRPGSLIVVMKGGANRLKFVRYQVSIPRNVLVIDLLRVTTSARAQDLNDGCLSMTSWSAAGARARAKGRELQPLFEHGLVLTLRGEGGAPIAEKPLTAIEGVFKRDFSGYAVPGRWTGSLPFSVQAERRAMLEAWSASAKDGSLECLVQTPVLLKP